MSFFFNQRSSRPSTSRGERTYAIGDVHGRFDLLTELIEQIADHDAHLPESPSHIVFLGDLVDRGPDSAKVLEWLFTAQRRNANMIMLLGNHEEAMIRAIGNEPGMLKAWLRMGGVETLRSFGIDAESNGEPSFGLAREIRKAVPPHLVEWMRGWPLHAQSGDYFFCHAGVRPGVALKRQSRNDLLWIREPFLSAREKHGAVIVHGHSVATEIQDLPNRIGIDTGAYRTGILTALYLEGTARDFISVNEADLGNGAMGR